jgi:hypothetical protein
MNSQAIARRPAIDHDWRFAELIARATTEPELAVRYREDSRAVLGEFGIEIDDRDEAPSLSAGSDDDLIIEDVGSTGFALYTLCASESSQDGM